MDSKCRRLFSYSTATLAGFENAEHRSHGPTRGTPNTTSPSFLATTYTTISHSQSRIPKLYSRGWWQTTITLHLLPALAEGLQAAKKRVEKSGDPHVSAMVVAFPVKGEEAIPFR
jgi:hypothetical protein